MKSRFFQKRLDKPVKFTADFFLEKAQEVPEEETGAVKWIVEGYAIVAGNIDEQLDRIESHALQNAVSYLEKYTTVLFNHDPDRPIGKILKVEVRESKIWVKVQIGQSESDLWSKVVEGIINSFSLSGEVDDFAYEYDQGAQKQIRVIKSFRVYEISLVSVPANPEAKTLAAYISKSLGEAGHVQQSQQDAPGGEVTLDNIMEILNITMEVVKAMNWKEKLSQAIKSLGELAAKVSDDTVRSALQSIQKLLTDVASEAPQNYPDAKSLEDVTKRLGELEAAVSNLNTTVKSHGEKIETFEKSLTDIDEVMNGLGETLKSLSDDGTGGGTGE